MKKVFILIATAAALVLCACSKENTEAIPAETGKVSLNVQFDVTTITPSTKAVKVGWENGDIIYCWFDEKISETPDMTLTYDGSAWKASEVDAAIVADLEAEGILKYFWIGTNDLDGWAYDGGSFKPASGKGFPRALKSPSGVGYDVVYTYDAATKTLKATLKWDYATNFQVVVTDLSLEDDFTFRCEGASLWNLSSINVNATNISTSNGDLYDRGVANEDGVAFNMILTSGGEKTFNFVLLGPDDTRYVYTVSKTIELEPAEAENSFFAIKLAKKNFLPTINGYAYVEMGDGLKWATMNVGATKPEEFGDYFAWGETSGYKDGKTDFSWGTYKWMQEGRSEGKFITKYSFADGMTAGIWYDGDTFVGDNKTSLADYAFADDAARQIWKGSWRIPTDAQWTWLRENCDWAWTDDYEGTGVAGRIVTSKVSGYEGNTIFLPAAGFRFGTSLYGDGSVGNYWSSSLREDLSVDARFVNFDSEDVGRNGGYRCYGVSVRPVSE